ncbi:MAG: CYCXC family (seleno)protein [Fidelibacterota bacterium]
MNRKKVVIALSLLTGLIGIGGGIVVYLSTRPSGSGHDSAAPTPGTPGVTVSELSSRFDCPCGHCSLSLDNCACSTADQVRGHLGSLTRRNLSEQGITDAMVRRYGKRILGKGSLAEGASPEKVPPYYENVTGLDLPKTLDPESVYPRARPAYEAARAYPELLMQMPCYCGCEVERGLRKAHKSLLDCFVDLHAAGCRTCMEEALFARRNFEEGMRPDEIRREIMKVSGAPTG